MRVKRKKTIRIGTRESALAVWQATHVKELLQAQGIDSELVYVKSEGDIDLLTPLYEMGVQGIFTKTLDVALLSGQVDLVVHSLKDVPTQAAWGLAQMAVLKRASELDILVYNGSPDFLNDPLHISTIATSSIRRKAQWLNRFPNHQFEILRGNVNTRLEKLAQSTWQGAIFAAAGLERINIRPENSLDLDWMLPAPAQGAIAIYGRADDTHLYNMCQTINHTHTQLCTCIERDFLRSLMGGCSMPISAFAKVEGDDIIFKGNVLSADGQQKVEIERVFPLDSTYRIGRLCAWDILEHGASDILKKNKRILELTAV